jgi:hypothetical protein
LNKEGKAENQQAPPTTVDDRPKTVAAKQMTGFQDKIVGCCGRRKSKSKSDTHPKNYLKMQNTHTKYEQFDKSPSSKFDDKMTIRIPLPKIPHVADISTMPLQQSQQSTAHNVTKDSTSDGTELVYSTLFRIK